MQELSRLSDDDLLRELHALVGSHRRAVARIVAHLGEVDVRRIYAKKGFSSLFSYSVEQLGFSEDEACRRIETARLARRFPCIYELLDSGAVTLTVLALLKPHLTNENHQELFAGVSGVSVRLAKEWLAERFPQPDVPASIRKCPEPRLLLLTTPSSAPGFAPSEAGISRIAAGASVATRAGFDAAPALARIESPGPTMLFEPGAGIPTVAGAAADVAAVGGGPRGIARVEPLSRDRFVIKLTVSRAVRDKLEFGRDLMRHRSPSGDLAVVIERALDALLVELARTKLAQTKRPQRKPRTADPARVTNATRREVVERDGLGCSFVAPDGRRCGPRAFLEFDHETPKGRGGSSEPRNLRILCRAHNQLAAARIFGEEHMRRALEGSRERKAELRSASSVLSTRVIDDSGEATR